MSANDIQAIDDLMTLISDARQSIQDAHSIAHIVRQLKNHEKDPESAEAVYYSIITECAENIISALSKYSFGYIPEDPLSFTDAIESD